MTSRQIGPVSPKYWIMLPSSEITQISTPITILVKRIWQLRHKPRLKFPSRHAWKWKWGPHARRAEEPLHSMGSGQISSSDRDRCMYNKFVGWPNFRYSLVRSPSFLRTLSRYWPIPKSSPLTKTPVLESPWSLSFGGKTLMGLGIRKF